MNHEKIISQTKELEHGEKKLRGPDMNRKRNQRGVRGS